MPVYKYTATDSYGNVHEGTLDVFNQEEAALALRRKGLRPEKVSRSWRHLEMGLSPSVRNKDLLPFTQQFAALVKAAVPVTTALEALQRQTEHKKLKRALQEMNIAVESGQGLTEAMRAQEKNGVFPSVYVNMVSAGNETGNLDIMLDRLATFIERTEHVRGKVKGALVMPAVLLLVAIGAVALMLTFVVPTFVTIFEDAGVDLPFLTQLLVDTSFLLRTKWWALLAGLGVLGGVFYKVRQLPGVQMARDYAILKLPKLGDLVRKGAQARFARTLATLLGSGVGILSALQQAADVAGNAAFTRGIKKAIESITGGSDIATPLDSSGLFSPMMISMVAVGEQAGNLDEMLTKAADFFEAEVERAVDAAVKVIEPAMTVVIAGLVAVIAASLYLPLFDMITQAFG